MAAAFSRLVLSPRLAPVHSQSRTLAAPADRQARVRAAAAQPAPMTAAAAAPSVEPVLPPIGDRKLRILCLHGYLQNAEVFRSRIGSMRKALKGRAEFFFMDAPYTLEPEAVDDRAVAESGGAAGAVGRSWWQWSDLEPGTRPSRAAQYSGWHASQAAIDAALQQHAPIDGLLGFSQGATAASLFLAHARLPVRQEVDVQQQAGQQQPQPQDPQAEQQQQESGDGEAAGERHLRFAVIIAGFLPRDASYADVLRRGRPALPSLHVYGASDELVPEERSRGLWECFEPGCMQTYQHPGAHMVPTCSGEFKAVLAALLDDVKQQGQGPAATDDAHRHRQHGKHRGHGQGPHPKQLQHNQPQQQQQQQQTLAAAAAGSVEAAVQQAEATE